MFAIRWASEEDLGFWFTLDKYLGEDEFLRKCRDKRGYILSDGGKPIGIMRYNLFWDTIPFLTFIYICDGCRRKGFGRQAMAHWENEMRECGYKMLMTSTQVNEEAQHFYRKLGYIDRGGIFLDSTPFAQPQEVVLLKAL